MKYKCISCQICASPFPPQRIDTSITFLVLSIEMCISHELKKSDFDSKQPTKCGKLCSRKQ